MKPLNTSCSQKPDLFIVLRSGIFFIGIVLSTLIAYPFMVLASKKPFEIRHSIVGYWVRFNLFTLEKVCKLNYEVQGAENIPKQPCLIMSKHQAAWETIALLHIFPPLVYILKQELLKIPVWGWGLKAMDPIAIDRSAKSAAMKQVLRDGQARLEAGLCVAIFPEGTRVPPGQKGQYNASGGILAHRTGAPVIPVAHNAGLFWKRGGFMKYPGTIQVRIGQAIDSSQLSANEINQKVEEWIETQMAEIESASASDISH